MRLASADGHVIPVRSHAQDRIATHRCHPRKHAFGVGFPLRIRIAGIPRWTKWNVWPEVGARLRAAACRRRADRVGAWRRMTGLGRGFPASLRGSAMAARPFPSPSSQEVAQTALDRRHKARSAVRAPRASPERHHGWLAGARSPIRSLQLRQTRSRTKVVAREPRRRMNLPMILACGFRRTPCRGSSGGPNASQRSDQRTPSLPACRKLLQERLQADSGMTSNGQGER